MTTAIVIGTVVLGATLALAIGVLVKSRVRVDPGHALIINTLRDRRVTFHDAVVLPLVTRAELVDLSVKRLVVSRRGMEGLITADSIRVDADATFVIRIRPTIEDVLRVVEAIGARNASDARVLEQLFVARFADALKTVAAHLRFAELHRHREELVRQVIAVLGPDLHGFVIDDVVIDHLEHTPIEHLDPANVIDAESIRKIRELTKGAGTIDVPRPGLEPFARRLADQGLLDIEVGIEVACDVATDRTVEGRVAEHRDALSRLVAPALLDSLGEAQLSCRGGRAVVRFTTYASEQQVLNAARLVHALKQDSPIFR